MSEIEHEPMHDELKSVAEFMPHEPVAPAHGIAAIALSMAMKYVDITTVQDGTLYQQYKLEGKNLPPLHLDMVFEAAIQIERHLVGASDRIAAIVVEAITADLADRDAEQDADLDAPASEPEAQP